MLFERSLMTTTIPGREAVALSPWQTGAIFVGIPLVIFLLISAAVLLTTRNSPDPDPAQPVLGTPTPDEPPTADSPIEPASPNEGSRPDDDADATG